MKRWRRGAAALASAVLSALAWCNPIAAAPPIVINMKLSVFEVAAAAAAAWPSEARRVRTTFTHVRAAAAKDVIVELYDSTYNNNVIAAGNCVASTSESVIDCDLAMVDSLIVDLKLVEIFGNGDELSRRYRYRKAILSWVLAHEMGHVVLKHGLKDFDDRREGLDVYSLPRQREELEADRFALRTVAASKTERTALEQAIVDMANALLRKALCPASFPAVCDRIPAGAGLIYDYRETASPILVPIGRTHPAMLARFLRILLLDDRLRHDVGYEAAKVIALLRVEDDDRRSLDLKSVLDDGGVSAPRSR